ncbi:MULTISPECIES: hypothetical protein [unclassified Virgibacillus]|uniref:hypothetical protein n=1 Tax=unclassified Virgibacillus TaxID=2620237 RepID=UPI0024DEA899|nr:hypothetical protein [Virgibacillus sp. LDC-1]
MSEKNKKVIHVRDLVIKADQVHLEQPPPPRRKSPFWGFGPDDREHESREDGRESHNQTSMRRQRGEEGEEGESSNRERVDPFWGRPMRREPEHVESASKESESHESSSHEDEESNDDRRERRPFSWI